MPISLPRSNRLAADTQPNHLRPFAHHGVHLEIHGGHAVGDCPFCGRDGKFSVAVDTGLWRCFVCGSGTKNGGGNPLVFLRLLHERSSACVGPAVAALSTDRKLLDLATLPSWGVCQSVVDGAVLVPGYGTDGALDQLYRRVWVRGCAHQGGSWRLLPTPGVWPEGKVHALHLPPGDFDLARDTIDVCEGPWDGMAMWEVMHGSGLAHTTVVAVPGCNVWRDEWTELCRGKHVRLWFDSDHPRVHFGHTSRAGFDGMYRVARRLSGAAASVQWLRWGKEGWDETRPSGWDVRDFLTSE